MTSTLMWFIIGIGLCLSELILPTAFFLFIMGLAALVVAAISVVLNLPNILIALWVIFSLLGILLSRRYLTPKKKASNLEDDREGETITSILPGKTGRVLYEGNSWQAKCVDQSIAIAENELVYVVEKKGNTLMVLPSKLLS